MKEKRIRFESYDFSFDGSIRTSSILRRLQQIAQDDLDAFGIHYNDLKARGIAFVISRMALSFQRPVPGEKDLSLATAANPVRGITFPRTFRLWDENGVILCAKSHWALIDLEKRSLVRPSALGTAVPTDADLAPDLVPARLVAPKDTAPQWTDTRRVYPSMLDRNGHLNNCNYADLACDLLPPETFTVGEIHIAYQHEALVDQTLILDGFDVPEGRLVVGRFPDEDKICFYYQVRKR